MLIKVDYNFNYTNILVIPFTAINIYNSLIIIISILVDPLAIWDGISRKMQIQLDRGLKLVDRNS